MTADLLANDDIKTFLADVKERDITSNTEIFNACPKKVRGLVKRAMKTNIALFSKYGDDYRDMIVDLARGVKYENE